MALLAEAKALLQRAIREQRRLYGHAPTSSLILLIDDLGLTSAERSHVVEDLGWMGLATRERIKRQLSHTPVDRTSKPIV